MPKPVPPRSPAKTRSAAAAEPRAGFAEAAAANDSADPTAALLKQNLGDERRRASPEEALAFFCAGLTPGSLPYKVMTAAAAGDAGSLASLLKRDDVLPEFANAKGFTPLMAASVLGQMETTELLAAHPLVNLGRQNPDGWTALHFAAWAGEAGCVSRLLQHRAPIGVKNGLDRTAFGLGSTDTQAAFWQDREFARQMRRQAAGAPEESAGSAAAGHQEDPVAEEPPVPGAAPAKKKDSAVKDAFFNALLAASLGLKEAPHLSVEIAARLASLPAEEFAETFKRIEAAKIPLDWTDVFIAAAARDNARALWLLQDRFYYETSTLNRALGAALDGGDNRAAAHCLLVWGAEPEASYGAGESLRDRAFNRHLAGCFEEMVLWPASPGKRKAFMIYQNAARDAGFEDMSDTLRLWQMRINYKGVRAKPLNAAFNQAAESKDLLRVMAIYAEARQDRLLRGTVELDKKAGGNAISMALRRERYDFARMLISGGYHLENADESYLSALRMFGSKQAKKFAEDHLSGKLAFNDVADAARMVRSQMRVHTTGFPGGRHGMWG